MFENIINFFKKIGKKEENKQAQESSKNAAKERLHLVLMQDRANVSADFLELMKQEIIDVIKKYIEIDEKEIDVRLTNKENEDGTNGAPALYANIPILNIKNESRKVEKKETEQIKEEKQEEIKENTINKKENKEEITVEEHIIKEEQDNQENEEENISENQEGVTEQITQNDTTIIEENNKENEWI
ncbi:MAG: cell division topological specificity factor MinE [Clostridia bacterium]|nr:cell division topological specificity factor MinE [Clostridia bacterium]